ncbi:cytochrome P450 1A2 isoform X2 [Dromiciops gliroides]|uniref:cytochrome P450 1A2 isoform X2 n=1 Tax=Dromiciops gliroides TaxID=33562 RepID=UPI001CC558C8|nr:cytochrome P450 1A2 isoform X2 [Dromiciops gliroides]
MVVGLLASVSISELLLAFVIFCLVFWIIESYPQRVPKGLKSPPGPWAWPLIGNILTLGKNPHLALARLREKYGDVMQIHIGSTPVLVLSGLETIRQALVRQGEDFKGRPDLYSFTLVADGNSMSFNPDSGEVWAARRKLAQSALNTFSVSSSPSSSSCYLEEHVKKEAESLIQKFQELMDGNNIRDITDALFKHSQDKAQRNISINVPEAMITNLVNDIFGAGFDTVTTAISWSLMYLVTKPEVQKKIQEELDTVIGRERSPLLADRTQLPYMEAFILEIFRHTSFVPFTIPHSTTRATTLNNFYIPKGTCVFVNQWQVNHDQKLWGDPFMFRPERFLSADGTINKALSEKVILFGLGKRRCIGEILARWEIFLFLAILLHQMEFSVPSGVELDLTPTFGLTMKHARCEHFQAKLRSSWNG